MNSSCILLTDGFEEIEAVTTIDILRRAGVSVAMVGVDKLSVTGSHAITMQADMLLEQTATKPWDLVVLPGGLPGAITLKENPAVQQFLRIQAQNPRTLFAAICAGPIALAAAGLLNGRRATCYPGQQAALAGAHYLPDTDVVCDGPCITSRGVGTAIAFSLKLVELLRGAEAALEHSQKMLVA